MSSSPLLGAALVTTTELSSLHFFNSSLSLAVLTTSSSCTRKNNSVSIHQRNLQLLLIEIYKTVNNLNPSFMAEVFVTNVVPYILRGSTNLVLPKARTNLYGIDTVRFVGQKSWQSMPKEIKESQSLDIFKRNIKAIPLDCSCKLCNSYILNLGFFSCCIFAIVGFN